MSQDTTTVTAVDIARLVDVGRAAVSNWRRRYPDFPRPVGGTAASPLFALTEVEDWLRRNGKKFRVSPAERLWQQLRANGDDLHLGELVHRAGLVLLGHTTDPDLSAPLADLVAERGRRAAFEFLCDRYQSAHSRQLTEPPAAIAELLGRLISPYGGTVLDPACGLGTLLIAAHPTRAVGQDPDPANAAITAIRLALRDIPRTITPADALHDPAPTVRTAAEASGPGSAPDAGAQAGSASGAGTGVDAVVCRPPGSDRGWAQDELAGDARWVYGVPPRGELELAWVQHCLAQVKPGGLVGMLLPSVVAGRRGGRRIRGNLLRGGALRAIFTVDGADLWVLRRPASGDRLPDQVLLFASDDHSAVERAWREFGRGEGHSGAVSVIDLLDEDIDLSPGLRQPDRSADIAGQFAAERERFREISFPAPELVAGDVGFASTTVGELAKSGALSIGHSTEHQLLPGDVVASRLGEVRVVAEIGESLQPQWARYRVDPQRLDAEFLAGVLRAAGGRLPTGSSRMDVRRTVVPRLPIEQQRRYGQAFAELDRLARAAREAAEVAQRLARLGCEGLVDGQLRPGQ